MIPASSVQNQWWPEGPIPAFDGHRTYADPAQQSLRDENMSSQFDGFAEVRPSRDHLPTLALHNTLALRNTLTVPLVHRYLQFL